VSAHGSAGSAAPAGAGERLRVLVVPKWYPWPELPVFGAFCREHAHALATRHDVVVLASLAMPRPGFAAFRLEDAVEDGVRTLRVRYRRPFLRPAAMGFQLLGMLAALRRLRREGWRPDIVHAHMFEAAPPALVLGRLSGAKVAITEHYTGFSRGLVTGYDRVLARLSFGRADVVAPVSHELAGHLRALAPGARIEVVPNVVDTEVFAPPAGERPPGQRLFNVAWLAEKKGHRYLLEALTELPEATLDVVGDGELRGELERLTAELGLADRVRFLGERPKAEVAERMRAADLFVLPSLAENLPVVLIEAQASGLPAVATRVGGVPELLDEHTGTLVDPADAPALAAAIRATLVRRSQFDPAALAERARERYGYDAICARWTEIYAGLGSSSAGTTRSATSARRAASE
jgi:L-malate glycosyltransferase